MNISNIFLYIARERERERERERDLPCYDSSQ